MLLCQNNNISKSMLVMQIVCTTYFYLFFKCRLYKLWSNYEPVCKQFLTFWTLISFSGLLNLNLLFNSPPPFPASSFHSIQMEKCSFSYGMHHLRRTHTQVVGVTVWAIKTYRYIQQYSLASSPGTRRLYCSGFEEVFYPRVEYLPLICSSNGCTMV